MNGFHEFNQHDLFRSLENFKKFAINFILNYFYNFLCDTFWLKILTKCKNKNN